MPPGAPAAEAGHSAGQVPQEVRWDVLSLGMDTELPRGLRGWRGSGVAELLQLCCLPGAENGML